MGVMTQTLRLTLSLLLVFSAMAAPARAQENSTDIDWKRGVWGDLSPHIGTYHGEEVLKDPRVKGTLKNHLTNDQYQTLLANITVQSPIGFDDDCLLISGNAPSAADKESAFVAVCVYDGTVHAALKESGQITVYTGAQKYSYLPQSLQLWVHHQINPEATALPSNVQIRLLPR